MDKNICLSVRQVSVGIPIQGKEYPAVDCVSLDLYEQETLAIVGESGCGKSTLALSIIRLLDEKKLHLTGQISFRDKDLLSLKEEEMQKIRGNHISMIYQDPMSALNPVQRIRKQIEEALILHTKLNAQEREKTMHELLSDMGISDPKRILNAFPHELSGGLRQRIVIAMALACEPNIIIADEPTTALDVTIQAQILNLINRLQQEYKSTMLLITHDLGVVAEVTDRVAVMYAGELVEISPVVDLFDCPLHPYTQALLKSIPSLDNPVDRLEIIEGNVPTLTNVPRQGCRFRQRIGLEKPNQHDTNPDMVEIYNGHWVRCYPWEVDTLKETAKNKELLWDC